MQNVDAQTTFTLEIAARMRNLSRKTASNLQHGKYQDLIRGSLTETDHVAGRSVSYDYDNHGRIASAETSDSAWGLKYDYDDFGNRTSQRVTQGSAYGHEASYVRRTCLG